jgi:hypothetical protein
MEKSKTASNDKLNSRNIIQDVPLRPELCDSDEEYIGVLHYPAEEHNAFELQLVESELVIKPLLNNDMKTQVKDPTSESEVKVDIVRDLEAVRPSAGYPPAPPPPDALD